MLNKTDLTTPNVIEGWLQDLSLTCVRRTDSASNWALEFTISGPNPLVLSAVNPKSVPRAVMLVCGLSAAPAHIELFKTLEESARREFWRDMRDSLNREYVEFQLDGAAPLECPRMLRVTALRFDDALSLDSFARSISSVCKAAAAAVAQFTDKLGDPNIPTSGEFAFRKVGTQ
ncbi:MAG TPA: DUF2299 family protein [Steroidobacteraceae bacterium]|jgi:hypothetical protein|nr:DUF2299 family protein [Steroidobacteraceae bacterium]